MIGKWAGVSKRKADEIIRDSVTEQQEAAVQSLLETRKKPGVSGLRNSPHSFSSSHVASASGGAGRSSSSTSLQGQRLVSTMHQSDIRRSNDATVEMAIADFFHSNPRCSGGIISIQATDKCVSSSWRQVCSSECQ